MKTFKGGRPGFVKKRNPLLSRRENEEYGSGPYEQARKKFDQVVNFISDEEFQELFRLSMAGIVTMNETGGIKSIARGRWAFDEEEKLHIKLYEKYKHLIQS